MKNKMLNYALWAIMIGWVLFSGYYIGRDMIGNYQTNVVKNSYQQGYADSISALITEAKKCQPVTAYSGEEKIDLVWTDCLKQNTGEVQPQ